MKRLVLIGAGHAHAQVLHEFTLRAVKDVELVLISPFALAPYSGMVPGWLAGHYKWEECCIDFVKLCKRAGARLQEDLAADLDAARSEVLLESGGRLAYDWLSLNIGSTLVAPQSEAVRVLPMRPLSALHQRWDGLLQAVRALDHSAIYRVLMVGGGAAGVESILAAHHRLNQINPHVRFQFTLATQGGTVLSGMAAGASNRLEAHLNARGIHIVRHFSASHIDGHTVHSSNGQCVEADAVLWATGAQAYAWPAQSGLAVDARGFIRIDRMLRSVSHPNVFASGDCSSWEEPLPKAGVYAVRMGPVLAHNLHAVVQQHALQAFAPQRRYLALIGTGEQHAVAAWGTFSLQGKWLWDRKERIDRRFLARYNMA